MISKLALILLLFTSSHSVFSQELNEPQEIGPIAKSMFEGMDREIRNDHTLESRSPFIQYSTCSGTYLNESGHFLTALHCLTHCLQRSYLNDKGIKVAKRRKFNENGYDYTLIDIDVEKAKTISCKLDIGPYMKSPYKAKIVALGASGYLHPKDYGKLPENPSSEFKKLLTNKYNGSGFQGDFAILKIESVNDDSVEKKNIVLGPKMSRPGLCTNVSSKNLELDTSIWSLSFPSYEHGLYDPQINVGKIIKDEYRRNKLEIKELQTFSYNTYSGSSGSSFLDSEGNIGGILIAGTSDGHSIGIKIEHILDQLSTQLSAEKMKEIFNSCERDPSVDLLIDEITNY